MAFQKSSLTFAEAILNFLFDALRSCTFMKACELMLLGGILIPSLSSNMQFYQGMQALTLP